MIDTQTLAARLAALWDHLGLSAAHVATQMPADLAEFAADHPARIAGLLLHEPTGFDATRLRALEDRIVIVAGDGGLTAQVAASATAALPRARSIVLHGYAQPIWADHVRDRSATIIEALRSLPGSAPAANLPQGSGLHAGISYNIQGSGPALVLFPLFLAPTQWEAALPDLTAHFTVIRLGGAYLGGVALLEDRARSPSYAGMVRQMLDLIAPAPGETMLEIGCGSGALSRIAAQRGGGGPITASDLNPFLLSEAAFLAAQAGLAGQISFVEANAEHLPFPDASFDHVFTVTVLEECNAEIALQEAWRVMKPGGRLGVIVRAIDLNYHWQLDLPEALRRKTEAAPALVGPQGVADRSLYRRVKQAGFELVHCFPSTPAFSDLAGPFWQYLIARVEPRLDEAERSIWRAAVQAAREEGVLFVTCPHHCVVAVKPA